MRLELELCPASEPRNATAAAQWRAAKFTSDMLEGQGYNTTGGTSCAGVNGVCDDCAGAGDDATARLYPVVSIGGAAPALVNTYIDSTANIVGGASISAGANSAFMVWEKCDLLCGGRHSSLTKVSGFGFDICF
jgi:hypothetical protein